jgi:hypothetical protein
VKVQRSDADRLRLTCAAAISPWEKAHLAMQLTREAEAVLGKPFDVDIVDSYIGAPQRKVAELRWNASDHRATVVYDDDFTRSRLRRLAPQVAPLRSLPAHR